MINLDEYNVDKMVQGALNILDVLGLEMSFYPEQKIVYVHVRSWNRCYPPHRTKKINNHIALNYDSDNELLGVEIDLKGKSDFSWSNKMGWKSTVDMTRQDAIQFLSSMNWEELSNDNLGLAVEIAKGWENHGHNYKIVENLPKGED